jgi:hypothetical protein
MDGDLTIHGPQDPANELPSGTVGQKYDATLTASGGSGGGYQWEVVNPLPSGLKLDKDTGIISGQPDTVTAPDASITVKVTDSHDATVPRTFSLTIKPAGTLAIQGPKGSANELPPGTVGDQYTFQGHPVSLTASGGSGGYQWGLVNTYGMPSGLNLDNNTGIISGQPDATAVGKATLIVKVTDSDNATVQRTFPLTIIPALQISAKTEGGGGSITLSATGGVPEYTWTKVPPWPDWLDVSPEGGVLTVQNGGNADLTNIKGTRFTVEVTDKAQHNAQASFSTIVRRGILSRVSVQSVKFRPTRQLSLGRFDQLTSWLALLALAGPILGVVPIFVYAFTASGAHGTYLGVGLLTALAAFLVGCFIGFLFGIPRVVSSGQARLTTSDYTPSSNLAEVSDWLTKLLLGAGLVQLTRLGAPVSHLIDKVAAGLHGPGAYSGSATVLAGAIMFGYVIVGLLDGYVVTTIWYQKKLTSLQL